MQVSIHGSYGRPTVRDTLAYQIVMAPWWLAKVRSLFEVHSAVQVEVVAAQDVIRAASSDLADDGSHKRGRELFIWRPAISLSPELQTDSMHTWDADFSDMLLFVPCCSGCTGRHIGCGHTNGRNRTTHPRTVHSLPTRLVSCCSMCLCAMAIMFQ